MYRVLKKDDKLIICDYWTVFPKSKKALSSKYKINSWEVLTLDLGFITKSLIVTGLNTTVFCPLYSF